MKKNGRKKHTYIIVKLYYYRNGTHSLELKASLLLNLFILFSIHFLSSRSRALTGSTRFCCCSPINVQSVQSSLTHTTALVRNPAKSPLSTAQGRTKRNIASLTNRVGGTGCTRGIQGVCIRNVLGANCCSIEGTAGIARYSEHCFHFTPKPQQPHTPL